MPSEITIKAEVRNCRECGMRTIGSVGAAGFYAASCCQSCRDFADGMAEMQARLVAAGLGGGQCRRTADATARVLEKFPMDGVTVESEKA